MPIAAKSLEQMARARCCGEVRRADGSRTQCKRRAMLPATVSAWLTAGRITPHEARLIQSRFDNPGYRSRCAVHAIGFLGDLEPGAAFPRSVTTPATRVAYVSGGRRAAFRVATTPR